MFGSLSFTWIPHKYSHVTNLIDPWLGEPDLKIIDDLNYFIAAIFEECHIIEGILVLATIILLDWKQYDVLGCECSIRVIGNILSFENLCHTHIWQIEFIHKLVKLPRMNALQYLL